MYAGLSPDPHARLNLIVCDLGGADAVAALLKGADRSFAERTEIILSAAGASADDTAAIEKRLAPAKVAIEPDLDAAIARLGTKLASAVMGLRLYAAGTEPLIGSVVKTAIENLIDPLSVKTEHRGSLARRVQCVHCKGITENVTTNPVTCSQCGLLLMVRDHYSKRLAAFQGVCINAETPDVRPEPKVEFQ